MAEDLTVTIGADADDFIRTTERARDAFGRFTKGVTGDSKDLQREFARVSKSGDTFSRRLQSSVKSVQSAFRRGGLSGGFRALNTEVTNATKGFGTLRGAVGRVGLKALGGAAVVALDGFQKLTVAASALGAGLIGIGAKGAASFAKFETAFAQVLTLLPPGFKDVDQLERGVRELATTFGRDLLESTRAAYQAISQGVAPAQTVEFLETAFKAASAGATGTVEATNLLLSTLNAFGEPVENVTKVSDVFFNTIARGATTAEELSASIGQVAPIANAAGVSFTEVASALAALTLGGVNTAEAATQLKNTIAGIVSPSTEAAAALEEIGVNAELLREQGLEEAFSRLEQATGGSLDALTKFLPNIRAAQGGASLAGSQFDKFNEILAANRQELGATEGAAAKTGATLGKSFNRLSANVNDVFVSIGKIVGVGLGPALDAVTDFVDKAQDEIELVAQAFDQAFGDQIQGFFDGLRSESQDASTVAGSALRAIGEGVQVVSDFLDENSELIATFGAAYRAQLAIAEGAVGALALAAGGLSKALAVLLGIASSVASIFSNEVAEGFRDANELANSLGDTLVDFSGERFVGSFEGFQELPETFDLINETAKNASTTLDGFGAGARRLGDTVDDLAAAQRSEAQAAEASTTARTAAARSTQQQAAAARDLAQANEQTTVSARELFAQVDAGKITAQEATRTLNALATSARDSAAAQQELTTALQVFNETIRLQQQAELKERIAEIGITSENVAGQVQQAFAIVDNVLQGRFRAAGEEAVETFARTGQASREFLAEVQRLAEVQTSFLDVSVFDQFIAASGSASVAIRNFQGETVDSLRVVSNVLTGEFRRAGDDLVQAFARGKVSSREFRAEVSRLAQVQLGFDELFRDVNDLAKGFDTLAQEARQAQAALGTEIRASVRAAREAFDAGEISLDQYLQKIREAGDASREFADLTDTQVVVLERVREENEDLADTILDLANNLDDDLRPAFDDYLEAARQGALTTKQLERALGDLADENKKVADETRKLTVVQRDNAGAAREVTDAQGGYNQALENLREAIVLVNEQQQLQFELLAAGQVNFFDAATGVRLLNDGETALINTTNMLGARLDEVGQEKLRLLVRALGDGVIGAEQFKDAVAALAAQFGVLIERAESASASVQGAFAGGNRIGAFGGAPGGIQFDTFGRADAGASVFGSQRVTGSSNFQSQLEAELGALLGLAPKALRQRAARSGGINSLARQVGLLVNGGEILQTGRADVEAGEFTLSQRGLSDLGKVFADMLNRGRSDSVVLNNTFNVQSVTPEGDGDDMVSELAFKLRPALLQTGRLAAARSPVT